MENFVFGKIAKQDINLGLGTFSQTLPDGTVASLDKIGSHSVLGNLYDLVNDFVADNSGIIYCDNSLEDAIGELGVSGGGLLYVPPGVYKTNRSWTINQSNVEVVFARGASLSFQPTTVEPGADRAIVVHSGDSAIGSNVNIIGPIAKGDRSFVVVNPTGIAAGDWLMVQETDVGSGNNIVVFDYCQVLSVAGTTVTLVTGIGRDFPATHSTVFFNRVSSAGLVQNVVIRNAQVTSPGLITSLPGLFFGVCRNVIAEDCVSSPAFGNPYGSYRSSNISLINCIQGKNNVASEFASCAGLIIDGLIADASSTQQNESSTIVLDFGTYKFKFVNSILNQGVNIGVQLTAVADGEFSNNYIGPVRGVGGYNCLGLGVLGCQNVNVHDNRIVWGDGAGSTGISCGPSTGYTVNIASKNVFSNNIVSGFITKYSVDANDVLLEPAPISLGSYRIAGKFIVGDGLSAPGKLLNVQDATEANLAIHWTHTGINNWFAGPHKTQAGKWYVAFNADTGDVLTIDQFGALEVLGAGSRITLPKVIAPGTPATDKGYLYMEDDGTGKLQLVYKFPSGAAVQIVADP